MPLGDQVMFQSALNSEVDLERKDERMNEWNKKERKTLMVV